MTLPRTWLCATLLWTSCSAQLTFTVFPTTPVGPPIPSDFIGVSIETTVRLLHANRDVRYAC